MIYKFQVYNKLGFSDYMAYHIALLSFVSLIITKKIVQIHIFSSKMHYHVTGIKQNQLLSQLRSKETFIILMSTVHVYRK